MVKKLPILLFALALLLNINVTGQETAMDFDQADCAGMQHHLFAELESGKVVILEFVMLNCAPCITATKSLEKIIGAYSAEDKERIELYSMGFLNAYTCPQMNAWRTNNNFSHEVFTGGEQQVAYYGGMGMPTIVVLGSNQHKVYYKTSGYTPALDPQIRTAIDSALTYSALGIRETLSRESFNVYPTISSGDFTINVKNVPENSVVTIFNITGNAVTSLPVGQNGKFTIKGGQMPAGFYIARLKTGNIYSEGIKLIKQ